MICENFLETTCMHKSWDDSYSCWFVGACLWEFIIYRKSNVYPTRNYWKKMLVLFNWNEESGFSSTFTDLLKKAAEKLTIQHFSLPPSACRAHRLQPLCSWKSVISDSLDMFLRHMGGIVVTWPLGAHSGGPTVGHDDLKGVFQLKQFCDSVTCFVRSASHLQLEYLSVGLYFRSSRLLHWGIQAPSSVLRWGVAGSTASLGVLVTSWDLCICPGAALTGPFSWDAHQMCCL